MKNAEAADCADFHAAGEIAVKCRTLGWKNRVFVICAWLSVVHCIMTWGCLAKHCWKAEFGQLRPFAIYAIVELLTWVDACGISIMICRFLGLRGVVLRLKLLLIRIPIVLLPLVATDSSAGTADPSGVSGLILGAIGVVGLLVILSSLAIPFVVAKGPWRLVLLLPIIGFWGYQYHEHFEKPAAEQAWREAGYRKCESEVHALPEFIPVDGFLDEGVGVTDKAILQLFSERHLDFVEIYFPNSTAAFNGRIELDMKQARARPFVHLTLSKKGDPNCVQLLGDMERLIRWVPFLPDTCLAAAYLTEPTARYAIRLERGTEPESEQYGTWAIVDRSTAARVASLTTSEKLYLTEWLSKPEDVSRSADCRYPHSVLVNRFTGTRQGNAALTPDPNKRNPFLVKQITVVASPPFLELIAKRDSLPLIQMRTVKTPFKSGEWEASSSETALDARWQEAVNEARNSGMGHYHGQGAGYRFSPDRRIDEGAHGSGRLLDWGQRKLIGLQLVETGTQIRGGIDWDVSASEGGFLVFTNEWGKSKDQIVARYNVSGMLDWAVQIPGVPEIKDCGFGPKQAWATENEIVLSQPSCNNKEGTEWRLQKRDISFYKLPVAGTSKPNASHRQKDEQ